MKRTGSIIKVVLIGLAAFAGFGAITTLLWNTLLPVIFNLPQINFWQALGLLILSRILFGGFGHGFRGHSNFSRNRFHKKWMEMSAEERKAYMMNCRNDRWHFNEYENENKQNDENKS